MRNPNTARMLAAVMASVAVALVGFSRCDEKGRKPMDSDMAIPVDRQSPYLLLANKQHPLGETYAPEALAVIPAELTLNGKLVEMEGAAARAAEALVRDLQENGYTDIVVTSGYRTYAYQQSLFHTYMGNEQDKHPDWTESECESEVLTYSARPGTSEHQTGLCMDLISTENVVLDETFADNPAYAYLLENAYKFGFILRYLKGKEEVTGYTYEPWHYRFVGEEEARLIHEAGVTLEEYVAEN